MGRNRHQASTELALKQAYGVLLISGKEDALKAMLSVELDHLLEICSRGCSHWVAGKATTTLVGPPHVDADGPCTILSREQCL